VTITQLRRESPLPGNQPHREWAMELRCRSGIVRRISLDATSTKWGFDRVGSASGTMSSCTLTNWIAIAKPALQWTAIRSLSVLALIPMSVFGQSTGISIQGITGGLVVPSAVVLPAGNAALTVGNYQETQLGSFSKRRNYSFGIVRKVRRVPESNAGLHVRSRPARHLRECKACSTDDVGQAPESGVGYQ